MIVGYPSIKSLGKLLRDKISPILHFHLKNFQIPENQKNVTMRPN